jgi:AraC-like DNA-binding protein
MSESTVAASAASALLEFAATSGACRAALFERSGIVPPELEDADGRVPFEKYVALMRAAKELCGDPALALHFGEAVDVSEISAACMIVSPDGNWAENFEQMNRYGRLAVDLADDGRRFALEREGPLVWVVDTRRDPNDFPELTESTFARAVCCSRRILGGLQPMKAVHFTHAAPPYQDEYERVFQMPCVFRSDRNALLTDEKWLDYKIEVLPRSVNEVLRAHAEELLEKLDNSKSTRGRVEELLTPMLRTGGANVGAVAGKLGLSRQTLFRRLKAEGVTFEKVLDGLRRRLALQYLDGGKVSVNEAAYLLGFSDPASFSRAFKRWTGSSPRAMCAAKASRNNSSSSEDMGGINHRDTEAQLKAI